ncbi:MAG: hypothetical protein AABN33_22540 [Acidobacteriota bacterium]
MPASKLSRQSFDVATTLAEKQKEAIKMAEKALELFKKVSEKKVKFSTGLKRRSILRPRELREQ